MQTHGLPEGTFSLLFGHRPTTSASRLVTDPRIRAVGFTGSRQGGLALAAAAGARPDPIPVYAEMSSINPVFVLPGALADRGAELGAAYIASMNTGVGQLCTSPGLVFVVDGPGADDFVDAATRCRQQPPRAAPMLYAGLAAAFADGVDRLVENRNVTVAARGIDDSSVACQGVPGLFVTAAEQFLDDHGIQDEVFGPASVIVRVANVDQLGSDPGPSRRPADRDRARHRVRLRGRRPTCSSGSNWAGRMLFNGWPTGVEVGHAMVHGGPFPATSAPSTTSVGSRAIERFLRPVAYQDVPQQLLPPELRTDNPLGIWRRLDGTVQQP